MRLDEELAGRVAAELGDERLLELYRQMVLIRHFENNAGRAYRMGKIRGFCHLYIGQEAVAVGAMSAIDERDYVITAYREHGQALARGLDPQAVMDELYGKATGCSKGKGGSMHLFDADRKFLGGWGIVGGQIPTATGVGFAIQYREEDAVCLCFFGEGSIHQGAFHEALNMASLWGLPVVYITENNKYAMGTDIERISAVTDIQKKAISYDMAHERVNGQDIFAVHDALSRAVDRARRDSAPTYLDVRTYRYKGHSMSDPATYRAREEVEREQARDPIVRLRDFLIEAEIADEAALDEMEDEIKSRVKEIAKNSEDAPMPDPSALEEDIYVDWPGPID